MAFGVESRIEPSARPLDGGVPALGCDDEPASRADGLLGLEAAAAASPRAGSHELNITSPPVTGGWMDTTALNTLLNLGALVVLIVGAASTLLTVDSDISRGWTLHELLTRLPGDNWASYSTFLSAKPILTKAITSGAVYALGDALAQAGEGASAADVDRARLLRSAACGFCGHGPLSHYWYLLSDRAFALLGWGAWYFVPCKILLDQFTWGVAWNALYVCALRGAAGVAPGAIAGEVRETVAPLIRDGLKLWVPAHAITYGLVPTEHRLLWVDCVEVLWVVVLSGAAKGKDAAAAAAVDAGGADENSSDP